MQDGPAIGIGVALVMDLPPIMALGLVLVTLPGWLDVAGRILPGATELSVSVPLGQTFGLLIGIILIPVAIGAVAVDLGGEIIDMTIATGPAVLVFNIAVIAIGRRTIATSTSQSNPDRNARHETDRIAG